MLLWSITGPGERYRVWRSRAGDMSAAALIYEGEATALDIRLPGGTHYLQVEAANAWGRSVSNIVSVTITSSMATATPTVTPTPTPPLCDSGFESGAFEPCWSHGGRLAQRVVDSLDVGAPDPTTESPRFGRYAALLGDPSFGPSLPTKSHMPTGSAWMEQTVIVPNTATPRLSFWYRIVTYDVATSAGHRYDIFQLTVDGQEVFWDGNQIQGTSQRRNDLGWKQYTVNLSAWRGTQVTVRFVNWNGFDASAPEADRNNTWTYVDQLEVTP